MHKHEYKKVFEVANYDFDFKSWLQIQYDGHY